MRPMILVSAFLVIGLAVSCEVSDEQSEADPSLRGAAAEEQLDEAKTEMKEAVQALQDYSYARRAEFVGNMTKGLVEIQAETDRLSAKIENTSGAARADAKAKLDAVRAKWAEAKRRLELAESATESSWDEVQGGFNNSYGELRAAFDEARQRLSDEIEP